jgi:hypothetical protein
MQVKSDVLCIFSLTGSFREQAMTGLLQGENRANDFNYFIVGQFLSWYTGESIAFQIGRIYAKVKSKRDKTGK